MKPTAAVLQEIRKMRFEEAYEGWNAGRLTQAEAARILGVCERSFRRYLGRYEADGLDGLIDRRLEQVSNRQAPVDEVLAMTDEYRRRYLGWNVKHFHSWYVRTGVRNAARYSMRGAGSGSRLRQAHIEKTAPPAIAYTTITPSAFLSCRVNSFKPIAMKSCISRIT